MVIFSEDHLKYFCFPYTTKLVAGLLIATNTNLNSAELCGLLIVFQINSTHHLDEQISKYFKLVQLNSKLNLLFNGSVHLIHSSQLIKDSRNTLRGVCEFLQVGCDEQFIEDCSRIIYREGTKTRHFVVWTEEQKKLVREKLQNFPFLKNYDFDT